MILLANNEYNLNNYIKSANVERVDNNASAKADASNKAIRLNETTDLEKSSAEKAHFSETAVVLSLSKEGAIKAAKNNGLSQEAVRNESKLARVQRYMSRSLQLENEASRQDITAAERQTIQHEINKITLVVNNIDDSKENSTTKLIENSINLYGNVVSHNNEVNNNEERINAVRNNMKQEVYDMHRQMENLDLYV